MNVDFKITAWERVSIPEGKEDEVLKLIKEGRIQTATDLIDHLDESMDSAIYEGIIDETVETMSIIENDNQATLDIIDDNGNSIYTNA